MADKEQIKKILKDYYNTDMIIKEVVISEKQGQRTVNMFDELAARKWNIYKDDQKSPDVEKTETMLEKRRKMKAQQLFRITTLALQSKEVFDKWNQMYGSTVPDKDANHETLMDYSIGALYWLKILTPYEYEVQEQMLDEQGVLLGNKMMPKEPENPLGEFEQR